MLCLITEIQCKSGKNFQNMEQCDAHRVVARCQSQATSSTHKKLLYFIVPIIQESPQIASFGNKQIKFHRTWGGGSLLGLLIPPVCLAVSFSTLGHGMQSLSCLRHLSRNMVSFRELISLISSHLSVLSDS